MPYRQILQTFKDTCPGVRSVIFCDREGETIDFVSDFDSYHTQLLGAYHSEVILRLNQSSVDIGVLGAVEVRTQTTLLRMWPIGGGYYVVALCKRGTMLPGPAVAEVTRSLLANI